MTEIRTCWAIAKDGKRCGKRASHKGNHSLTIEWDDDECFQFEPKKTTEAKRELAPMPAPIAEIPPVDAASCVACSHKHAAGPCKCGCYEFVG